MALERNSHGCSEVNAITGLSPCGHPSQKRPLPSGSLNGIAAVFLFFPPTCTASSLMFGALPVLNKTCVNSYMAVMCSCMGCALHKDTWIIYKVSTLRSLFQWQGTHPTSLPLHCNNTSVASCFVLFCFRSLLPSLFSLHTPH